MSGHAGKNKTSKCLQSVISKNYSNCTFEYSETSSLLSDFSVVTESSIEHKQHQQQGSSDK